MPETPRKEPDIARRIRAYGLARGHTHAEIAVEVHDQCGPLFGTSKVKSQRLARGIALSDVVVQIRALYEVDGKPPPKLGETLLSAYESGYKKPGPAYLHYLCSVYRVEPTDLGFQGHCVCGRGHSGRFGGAHTAQSPPGQSDALAGSVVVPSHAAGVKIGASVSV